MDGVIGWIVFGFIAGAIARTIKPGQRGGVGLPRYYWECLARLLVVGLGIASSVLE